MEIKAKEIKMVDLASIKLNPKNRNKHPKEQIERIVEIMKYQGFRRPVSISNRSGVLVCGEGRYLAAKKLGLKQIPAIFQDYDSEEQEFADAVADNALDKWAELDLVGINEDLEGLASDFNLDLMGIKDFQKVLPNQLEPQCDEDEIPSDFPQRSKPGDVWKLGRHRLLCGDATKIDDANKLMQGELADLIVTDPPYNVDYEGGTGLKIKNDKFEDGNAFLQFLTDSFISYFTFANEGAALYVFHADSEGLNFRLAYAKSGFIVKQCCIWVKQALVMGRQDYQWKHEPILYGWKPGAAHSWYSDRKQTTIWEFDRPHKSPDHPTSKPVDLVSYPITNSSREGDLVLDFFGGSGSTLIACENTNRRCYMMELDPNYCDVILARWEGYTGQKASLETK